MNYDGKHQDMQNDHERELIDLLNLLKAIDQRITPEHLTRRFRELSDSVGDDGATSDSAGSPEPKAAKVTDKETLTWRKSNFSIGAAACVEVAVWQGMVLIRDSKDPSGAIVPCTRAAFDVFLRGVKDGEFDDLGQPVA